MGFRTVVMLSNDHAHEWRNDAELGMKIQRAMNQLGRDAEVGGYGRVVEYVHGDCQTLAVLDGYTAFETVAAKGWLPSESKEEIALKLLKEAARARGYQLVKRRKKPD